jgi:ATP-dependent exoDNAse (exonuclease V) beta subunit
LIHKFTTFDEKFWSSYKALEALLGEEQFKEEKQVLLNNKVFSEDNYLKYNISAEDFEAKKEEILKEWERKREESCVRGTAIHNEHELAHLKGSTQELQHLGLGGKFSTDTSNRIKLGNKGVYPELLLSRISPDNKLKIAGQADLIIVDGKDVYVCDYKTNKSIDKNAFFDRRTKKKSMMKYPLNNIQDTNFWHYSLQLSTYAWMIQKINPEFNIKMLLLIHYDHDGGCTHYECDYLKDDVERMLAYHKKQIEYDEFKNSRQKIIF